MNSKRPRQRTVPALKLIENSIDADAKAERNCDPRSDDVVMVEDGSIFRTTNVQCLGTDPVPDSIRDTIDSELECSEPHAFDDSLQTSNKPLTDPLMEICDDTIGSTDFLHSVPSSSSSVSLYVPRQESNQPDTTHDGQESSDDNSPKLQSLSIEKLTVSTSYMLDEDDILHVEDHATESENG